MAWLTYAACSVAWFMVGYVIARSRKVTVVRQDADVALLDKVLKLDRALYHEHDWLDHKSDKSPHVGLWLYANENGVHVDNRYTDNTGDSNHTSGPTVGDALNHLHGILVYRIVQRQRAFKDALLTGSPKTEGPSP